MKKILSSLSCFVAKKIGCFRHQCFWCMPMQRYTAELEKAMRLPPNDGQSLIPKPMPISWQDFRNSRFLHTQTHLHSYSKIVFSYWWCIPTQTTSALEVQSSQCRHCWYPWISPIHCNLIPTPFLLTPYISHENLTVPIFLRTHFLLSTTPSVQ